MNTRQLQELGQSLWLDNITRDLLDSGTLKQFIDDWSISGITSNPTIFDEAIRGSSAYDEAIRSAANPSVSDEDLFMELALDDLRRAADLLRPVFDRTHALDGWVSLEVSPLLVNDTDGTIAAAERIHARAGRPNFFVKIPGTTAGIAAIEECIFRGVPINVTLLFSRAQYLAASEAYMRALDRRLEAGLDLRIASVASLFISRWDKAVHDRVSPELRNRLGIAVAGATYSTYCEMLTSLHWQRLKKHGALPQRLLWASTGVKDPTAPDCLYVEALAAPGTISTLPEKTLRAFVDHGRVGGVMSPAGAAANATLRSFKSEGVDLNELAFTLQAEGAQAFTQSWHQLMTRIAEKRKQWIAA